MRGGNEGEALYRRPDPIARGGATGPLSPSGGATGPPGTCRLGRLVGRLRGGRQEPVARWGGDMPPLFFLQGLLCKFEEKKLYLSPVALIGRPGYIFEIFQNGHIFLKF